MNHIPRTPDEIAADRARYAAHQKKGLEAAPKALPPASPVPAPAVDATRVIRSETIAPGWYWTTRLEKGEALRITPETATTTVALACWSAADPTERMNLPDTVKVQWTTELSRGRVIFSDMGRVLLSITEDSCGAHDALTGGSTPGTNARFGDPKLRNTRENMVLAAAKLGLDRRDIPAILSLFAPVRVDAEGRFEWRPAMLSGTDWVELRAEMDLLVALSTCPHPLDPNPDYAPATMVATRLAARPVPADDICRTATPEAVRGFENNARA
ncbi:MAG: urea carboxylase [Rhodovulum sulfidophilum]|uniref:Urea carboxylase n=1 Tax=Rhodovulum sulfidophilum TaxID=35806 RepID=A0A2W5NK86_RHOSU|nr:MAG: urea carboxylase [Rhodovulum sulfidophilum]